MSKAGPAASCLELIQTDKIRLVMSEAILAEVKDVLSRPYLRSLSINLTQRKVEELIDLILAKAEFVHNVNRYFSYIRDKSDEPYLNLAIETGAVFLVSRDKDLLDLMTDHTNKAKEFRQRFRDLKIVDPVEFLKIIRKSDRALEP